jgi:hypothetical protein
MTDSRFVATFELTTGRPEAWARLTAPGSTPDVVRLPGFASDAEVVEADEEQRLVARKLEPPCAGTTIVVVFQDAATGTVVTVTQSGFDGGLPAPRELMEVGWRLIVADLRAALATGVDPGRHLAQWRDFGADVESGPGGVWVGAPRPGTLAAHAGLLAGDLLVGLGGAAVTGLDDLVKLTRATADREGPVDAAWIRDGRLMPVR